MPYWGFAEPENNPRPFAWGIAPMPRPERDSPHLPYWYRTAVAVRASAPDPLRAFAAVQALFTHGPAPRGGELPAYRTPEVMRAWSADPLPLGKECLLALDARTGPAVRRGWLYTVPGSRETLREAVEGRISAADAVAAIRAAAGRPD